MLVVVFGVFSVSPLASEAAITPGDPDNFITTWNSAAIEIGSTASNQIRILGSGTGYDYDIYWEDTASSSINGTTHTTSNNFVLTFPSPGIYRVEIAGDFPRILTSSNERNKMRTIEQWGSIQWTSMESAFNNAYELRVPATDAPDLSNVTNMSSMFYRAFSFNDPIGHWDVSNVTNMESVFNNAYNFNQPLNNWNVSSVTNMSEMFRDASAFNQPLDNWNVSNVTNMSQMFNWNIAFNAPVFNQPLNNWNTTNVTSMYGMFARAVAFNQPLDNWNISSSSNMGDMLYGTRLSTTNQDATLASWATQATAGSLTGRQLHIGLKSYSSVGADAIGVLQGLGWTITEQYSAAYNVSAPATLTGNAFQVRSSGQSTTPVTVNVPPQCSFLGWSDGNASTTRSDVLVDNLSVSANVDCTPKSSGQFVIKQSIYNEIALSIGSSLVLSPSIPGVTGGVSSGDLPFNVKTNNSLGYQVSLSFAQVVPFRHLLSPSSYIFNYVPQVVGVPDYNLVTPTKSHGFAYSVFSDNAAQNFRHSGSTCNTGSSNTLGKCWFNQADASVPTTIIERSGATGAEGATSTLQFRVVVDQNATPMLLEGEYQATVTVTVLPL